VVEFGRVSFADTWNDGHTLSKTVKSNNNISIVLLKREREKRV